MLGESVLAVGQPLISLIPPVGVNPPDALGLVALQGSMMRNYFRLARAQEGLQRKVRTAPRASAAEVLESERARLARELHAGAGQALAGIRIHLELIDSLLDNPPAQVRTSLERIGTLAQEALDQVRSVTRLSYPPAWERVRLAEAIEKLWNTMGISEKFDAHLDIGVMAEEPPLEIRTMVYRAAQEALANVVRHAGATRLRLRLRQEAGRVTLLVEDNGRGFGSGAAGDGIGLRAIRDQAADLKAEFRLHAGAGGTTFFLSVPVPEG